MFFDEPIQTKAKLAPLTNMQRKPLAKLTYAERTFEKFTDLELLNAAKEFASTGKRHVLIFDVECYPNYFSVSFKSASLGKVVYFELSPDCPQLDVNKLGWIMFSFCVVGFFSRTYDIPMVWFACTGANNHRLKELSDRLVDKHMPLRPHEAGEQFGFSLPEIDHIDIFNVAPLDDSLKLYAARLHCQRMQELPYEPETHLTREEAANVLLYNINDLDNTELLYKELLTYIQLREKLGIEYGEDFRSKSDAQMAEAIFVAEITKLTGKKPKRPKIEPGTVYHYEVPLHIRYTTPQLQQMLQDVEAAEFRVADSAQKAFDMPRQLEGRKIFFGDVVVKMGLGGLHSSEKSIAHYADEEHDIIDIDVESFYPNEILLRKLFPPHIGEAFLEVYRIIVNKRLTAKAEVGKIKKHLKTNPMTEAIQQALDSLNPQNDGLKIAINGSFGKLGNKWAAIFAPHLMIQVTVGCQLNLLMLIETLHEEGFQVLSVNTDGVVSKVKKDRYERFKAIVVEWENKTGFKMEETRYKATFNRDVNAYIILKEDGTTKVKGAYSERGSALNSVLSKNPETLICSEAIQQMIMKGTPLEETITKCRDIKKFVSVQKVQGGAMKDGVYLGKVVRWYYAVGMTGAIHYKLSGNKVAMTDGARPLMDLPLEFPEDMNFDWYIDEATRMAYQCGFFVKPTTGSLF